MSLISAHAQIWVFVFSAELYDIELMMGMAEIPFFASQRFESVNDNEGTSKPNDRTF